MDIYALIIPTISPTNDIPFCIHQWHPTRVDAYNSDLMELNKKRIFIDTHHDVIFYLW